MHNRFACKQQAKVVVPFLQPKLPGSQKGSNSTMQKQGPGDDDDLWSQQHAQYTASVQNVQKRRGLQRPHNVCSRLCPVHPKHDCMHPPSPLPPSDLDKTTDKGGQNSGRVVWDRWRQATWQEATHGNFLRPNSLRPAWKRAQEGLDSSKDRRRRHKTGRTENRQGTPKVPGMVGVVPSMVGAVPSMVGVVPSMASCPASLVSPFPRCQRAGGVRAVRVLPPPAQAPGAEAAGRGADGPPQQYPPHGGPAAAIRHVWSR